MNYKTKLVELLNELLNLFDGGNKLILKKLIALRHGLRNVCSDELVDDYFENFVAENYEAISEREVSALKNFPMERMDYDSIWSELSSANRNLVWEWIESISNIQKS